jgi:hypothetical protein
MWGGGGDAAEVVRAETERSVFVGPSAGDHCCCGAIRFGDILGTRDKWRLPEIFVGKPACTVPGVSLKRVAENNGNKQNRTHNALQRDARNGASGLAHKDFGQPPFVARTEYVSKPDSAAAAMVTGTRTNENRSFSFSSNYFRSITATSPHLPKLTTTPFIPITTATTNIIASLFNISGQHSLFHDPRASSPCN